MVWLNGFSLHLIIHSPLVNSCYNQQDRKNLQQNFSRAEKLAFLPGKVRRRIPNPGVLLNRYHSPEIDRSDSTQDNIEQVRRGERIRKYQPPSIKGALQCNALPFVFLSFFRPPTPSSFCFSFQPPQPHSLKLVFVGVLVILWHRGCDSKVFEFEFEF